ncbi:MAG: RNA polymerase sigma factor [Clostridia bacterium]|nr:RNA polymerase sigma factor [Clostridia bacterium]
MTEHKEKRICEEAVLAIAEGNKEALSVIYDSMARMIFSVAYAVTGNTADAEDVLQDTMLGVVTSAHTYQKGTNARAWILSVARNRAIDLVRKRRVTVPLEEITHLSDSQDGMAEDRLFAELTAPLSGEERQLVLLRLHWELSYFEIARIMAISVSAAQKRYQRALKKLKNIYL